MKKCCCECADLNVLDFVHASSETVPSCFLTHKIYQTNFTHPFEVFYLSKQKSQVRENMLYRYSLQKKRCEKQYYHDKSDEFKHTKKYRRKEHLSWNLASQVRVTSWSTSVRLINIKYQYGNKTSISKYYGDMKAVEFRRQVVCLMYVGFDLLYLVQADSWKQKQRWNLRTWLLLF